MRAALSAIAQWFKDAWNLPWSLKGPFIGVFAILITLLIAGGLILASNGEGDTEVSEVVRTPAPTSSPASTPTPEPTRTATPKPTPAPTTTPIPAPPAAQPPPPPVQQPPPPEPTPPPPPPTPPPPPPPPPPTPILSESVAVALVNTYIFEHSISSLPFGCGDYSASWEPGIWHLTCRHTSDPCALRGGTCPTTVEVGFLVFEDTREVIFG